MLHIQSVWTYILHTQLAFPYPMRGHQGSESKDINQQNPKLGSGPTWKVGKKGLRVKREKVRKGSRMLLSVASPLYTYHHLVVASWFTFFQSWACTHLPHSRVSVVLVLSYHKALLLNFFSCLNCKIIIAYFFVIAYYFASSIF